MKLKGNLYYNTQITFTYNTKHIEGSKLIENQTRYIYETNTLLTKKNSIIDIADVLETVNHFKLVDYVLDIAHEKLTKEPKNVERNIKELLQSYGALKKVKNILQNKQMFDTI